MCSLVSDSVIPWSQSVVSDSNIKLTNWKTKHIDKSALIPEWQAGEHLTFLDHQNMVIWGKINVETPSPLLPTQFHPALPGTTRTINLPDPPGWPHLGT